VCVCVVSSDFHYHTESSACVFFVKFFLGKENIDAIQNEIRILYSSILLHPSNYGNYFTVYCANTYSF
jgi:hypothetical protein